MQQPECTIFNEKLDNAKRKGELNIVKREETDDRTFQF